MEKVSIQSTSQQSAICSDLVLREGELVRLIFRPAIVDNSTEPAACVRGHLIYQKKGKRDVWADFETTSLSSLKKGEQYRLELHAGELLLLLKHLVGLYKIHRKDGVPQGYSEYVKLESQLGELVKASEPDLAALLTANPHDALTTLQRVLNWLSNNPDAAKRFADQAEQLPQLTALVGIANLRAVMTTWQANASNADEEFWQRVLQEHAFVLSQLLAYPIVVIKGKAYVGGKRVDNTHGNLVDFLCRASSTGAAVLIEIKTPTTELLEKREYRQDVFAPSREITGAISQVLQYRESLMLEMQAVLSGQETGITPCDPRCVIIAGSARHELKAESQRRSFERFRERLMGVTLLTFDEVFGRVRELLKLFEPRAGGSDQGRRPR